MDKLLKNISSLFTSRWRELIITFLSVVIGIFAQPILEIKTGSLFDPSNLIKIAFLLISIIFLTTTAFTLSMWRSTEANTGEIARSLAQVVQLVSFADGFKILQKKVQEAKSEVFSITNCVFDWESGKQLFDPAILQSEERKAIFEATQKAGKRTRKEIQIYKNPSNS